MEKKPKITDIYFDKIVTRPERNASGELERVEIEVRQHRPVRTLGAGLRFVHLIADSICYQILSYYIFSFFIEDASWVTYLLASPVYFIFFEFAFQRTPGKWLTKSLVVNEYGEPIDLRQAILRTVIRNYILLFDAISFLASSNHRGWHDSWSNTYVISEDELEQLSEFLEDPNNIGK